MTETPNFPHAGPTQDDGSPVVLINTFHPKPGKLDEFLERQIAETRHLGEAARAVGWRGNRVHRARDGRTVVIVTAFKSTAAKERWAASEPFAAHLRLIEPLLERVDSQAFDLVFESGGAVERRACEFTNRTGKDER